MTSELFMEYLVSLDKKMHLSGRKVALILDNCPAHPNVKNLQNVELFFLSPNTTSKLQPLDAGIINSMKAEYRKRHVMHQLISLQNKTPF